MQCMAWTNRGRQVRSKLSPWRHEIRQIPADRRGSCQAWLLADRDRACREILPFLSRRTVDSPLHAFPTEMGGAPECRAFRLELEVRTTDGRSENARRPHCCRWVGSARRADRGPGAGRSGVRGLRPGDHLRGMGDVHLNGNPVDSMRTLRGGLDPDITIDGVEPFFGGPDGIRTVTQRRTLCIPSFSASKGSQKT